MQAEADYKPGHEAIYVSDDDWKSEMQLIEKSAGGDFAPTDACKQLLGEDAAVLAELMNQ